VTPLEEAKKYLHDAIDNILAGGCKATTIVRIEIALEKLDEVEKCPSPPPVADLPDSNKIL